MGPLKTRKKIYYIICHQRGGVKGSLTNGNLVFFKASLKINVCFLRLRIYIGLDEWGILRFPSLSRSWQQCTSHFSDTDTTQVRLKYCNDECRLDSGWQHTNTSCQARKHKYENFKRFDFCFTEYIVICA